MKAGKCSFEVTLCFSFLMNQQVAAKDVTSMKAVLSVQDFIVWPVALQALANGPSIPT